jgi:enoyl-CoA hydratase/carnithine racemase
MPANTNIKIDIKKSIAIVTLNRPKSLNALSMELIDEFYTAIKQLEKDKNVLVIIITGANREDGRPCFCAGADIKNRNMSNSPKGEPLEHTLDGLRDYANAVSPEHQSKYNEVFSFLANISTPTIAAVDGICTTGGLELILACDLRFVGEDVQISDWHTKNLQAIGGAGVTTRLPKLINIAKAKEILWSGRVVKADEAVHIGLANQKFDSQSLLNETIKFAEQISEMSPYAISASKAVINKANEQNTQENIGLAQVWSALIAAQKESNDSSPPSHPLGN